MKRNQRATLVERHHRSRCFQKHVTDLSGSQASGSLSFQLFCSASLALKRSSIAVIFASGKALVLLPPVASADPPVAGALHGSSVPPFGLLGF